MTVAHPALAPPRITSRPSPDGGLILRSEMPLEPYEASLGVLLRRWAEDAPDRTFLAERGPDGEWITLTWSEANARASAIAQALLDRGLGPDRMLMILSGNSIDHALLMLGGFLAGVPVAPVSPAYSLMSADYGKVRHIADLVKPGLVLAQGDGRSRTCSPPWTSAAPRSSPSRPPPTPPARSTTRSPASAPTASPRCCSRPARRRCPRACSTRTGCCAPTSSRSPRSGRSPRRRRRCSSTGCRGTTRSVATTTST